MKKFTVNNILSWGLEADLKYCGYKLPVSFKYNPDIVDEIEELVDEYETKDIFYGDSKTVYFKIFELTRRQKEELLNNGRVKIDLSFKIDGTTKSKSGFTYLKIQVTWLRKSKFAQCMAPTDSP